MYLRFSCPACERPGAAPVPAAWHCPACGEVVAVADPPRSAGPEGVTLHACAACGNGELYKKKDFPHALGMAVVFWAAMTLFALPPLLTRAEEVARQRAETKAAALLPGVRGPLAA